MISSTARTSAYALITQSTSSSDACSCVIMSGIAMFTIVRSSRVMKNPSDMTISTAQGLPRYFRMIPPVKATGLPQVTRV